eukprot:Filipodium_phascolosomae@DN7306_c0_g1_i1.p1
MGSLVMLAIHKTNQQRSNNAPKCALLNFHFSRSPRSSLNSSDAILQLLREWTQTFQKNLLNVKTCWLIRSQESDNQFDNLHSERLPKDTLVSGSTESKTCSSLTVGQLLVKPKHTLVSGSNESKTCGSLTVEQLLVKHKEVWATSESDLGPVSNAVHRIPFRQLEVNPVFECRSFNSMERLNNLRTFMDRCMDAGVITPSNSCWSSPIFFLPKKNRTLRPIIDFRTINRISKKDSYRLPIMTEVLSMIPKGTKCFSSLDVKNAFLQIPLVAEDRHKTAFYTPWGHYEFTRLPPGLKNGPSTLQRAIESAVGSDLKHNCIAYMDDIL